MYHRLAGHKPGQSENTNISVFWHQHYRIYLCSTFILRKQKWGTIMLKADLTLEESPTEKVSFTLTSASTHRTALVDKINASFNH